MAKKPTVIKKEEKKPTGKPSEVKFPAKKVKKGKKKK